MKKYLFVILGIALFTAGCNKSLPSEPPYPTPTPYVIDNFEDGDVINMVPKSGGDNKWNGGFGGSGVFAAAGVCGGAGAGYGSYCFGVTGTIKIDPAGFILAGAWTVADAGLGTDFSAYTRVKFSAALYSDGPAGMTFTCNVLAEKETSIGNKMRALVEMPDDGQWHDYELDAADFVCEGAETFGGIMEEVKVFIWEIRAASVTQSDTANVEFFVDNVVLTR